MDRSFLRQPVFSKTRRNHALEHATIHLLSARHPGVALIGRSDPGGFYLFGSLPGDVVATTVDEALHRLRAGEARLSLHPYCGTNLLTAALLGGAAAFLSLVGASTGRRRLARLPAALAATLVGLAIAQPIGTALQRNVTTQADPEGLRIESVKTWRRGRTTLHRVRTSG